MRPRTGVGLRRASLVLGMAGLCWLNTTLAQPLQHPVDSLFPGLGAGAATSVPLRPPTPPVRRVPAARPPPFELGPSERFLWLGDVLLMPELESGYLETRITCHSTTGRVQFRHLSWMTNHPLARPELRASAGAANGAWLDELARAAALYKPTTVLLGFGTAAAAAGPEAVAAFSEDCRRLIDVINGIDPLTKIRWVFFAPGYHAGPTNGPPEIAQANTNLYAFAQALFELSTNREAPFINVIDWMRIDSLQAARLTTNPPPALTEKGAVPSPYGCARMTHALENGLSWRYANWRWGLLPDNKVREGGFGAEVREHAWTPTSARVLCLEEQLPIPNVPGYLDLTLTGRPQCYIQVQGLSPGLYELRVDGQTVLQADHEGWGRYQIVSQGPSWEQAEQVRQRIVEKNRKALQQWRSLMEASSGKALTRLPEDPAIRKLEDEIHELRRPVPRTYEVRRVGDVPAVGPRSSVLSAPPRPQADRGSDETLCRPTPSLRRA